ncbi:ribosome recycling factor [Candidatus Falkowbacteria bacterium CG10_big_fil_rev_8_21_14_0_10_43_10]|uniref:Ribosome-recycling factor n=1 Tax=Candidatus Falkowbacteria bacterium CG10_big_fil_rev_8_21_14_0_10_43_10 TaxID=1974567 RepID=A0A2H0V4B1_9BACT|nr:MAG: ribosome recycling factor [Candidatus Falkowbacteria bacterium CG10_big_fil_rev_8_21_14_0_10_43_10]
MNIYIKKHKGELDQVIEFFKKEIASIRTGRANPAMLDPVQVESYGAKVPLQQVGNISVVDAHCLIIMPWDKNNLKEVEKGIAEADLGVSAVNEGDKIRITIPQPTEEDRLNRVKKLNEKLEQSKIAIRQVRDKIKEDIEEADESKEISEDDKFRFLKEMEEEIKKRNEELQKIRDAKEKEIMTI